MKETLTDLKQRRSCRLFDDRQIDTEQLDEILEAATYAPTGMGMQSPLIVVLQNKADIERVRLLNARVMGDESRDPFYGAPTLVIVFADKNRSTYYADGVLVLGNMLNAAHAVGVASCYIYRAKEVFDTAEGKALMKEWGIRDCYEGIGNCILGYGLPEGFRELQPRKSDYIIKV